MPLDYLLTIRMTTSSKDPVQEYIKDRERFYRQRLNAKQRVLISGFWEFLMDSGKVKRPKVVLKNTRPPEKTEVAIISEDAGHLTGGRYYTYFLASALIESGYNVTLYTNRKPVFGSYFDHYKKPNVKVVAISPNQLRNKNIKADIYIGSPIYGCIAAATLAQKYSKPGYAIIFDPIPMIEKYKGIKITNISWEALISSVKRTDAQVISLCQEPSKYIYKWLRKEPRQVHEVFPCINSVEKKLSPKPQKRGDYVVFISRLVKHKMIEHTIQAAKENNVRLKIISSVDGVNVKKILREYEYESMTDIYMKASEAQKFEILRGAKVMVNSSIFEGFGMFLAEAIDCGTPSVVYEYPTFREIVDYSKANNVYFAKYNDPKDFSEKLKQALAEKKFTKESDKFAFERLVERMGEVVGKK